MAELDMAARARLAEDRFAYVDSAGERHLPIHDQAHVRSAIARWSETGFESARAKERARRLILEAARRFGIHVAQGDIIARPVR
jgi:hypothetical protein